VARRVIGALDRGTRHLDAGTLSRLYDSRRRALSTLHAHHAGQGLLVLRRHPALFVGLGLISLFVVGLWFGLGRFVPWGGSVSDTSRLDIQLLTGELPPQVFADWSLVTRENVDAVCLTDS
jgi:hypothetical protein